MCVRNGVINYLHTVSSLNYNTNEIYIYRRDEMCNGVAGYTYKKEFS